MKIGGQTDDDGPVDEPIDGPTNRRTSWIFEDLSILNIAIQEVRVAKRVTKIVF